MKLLNRIDSGKTSRHTTRLKEFILAIAITITGFGNIAYAAEIYEVVGRVTKVVTFSAPYDTYAESNSGLTAIYVEGLQEACGTGAMRVAIGVNRPVHDVALSLALTSYNTGKTVTIGYLDTCTVRSSAWDFAYMFLN